MARTSRDLRCYSSKGTKHISLLPVTVFAHIALSQDRSVHWEGKYHPKGVVSRHSGSSWPTWGTIPYKQRYWCSLQSGVPWRRTNFICIVYCGVNTWYDAGEEGQFLLWPNMETVSNSNPRLTVSECITDLVPFTRSPSQGRTGEISPAADTHQFSQYFHKIQNSILMSDTWRTKL